MDKLPTNINLTPHLVKNPLALIAFAVAAIVVLGIAAIWIPLGLALVLIAVVIPGAPMRWQRAMGTLGGSQGRSDNTRRKPISALPTLMVLGRDYVDL